MSRVGRIVLFGLLALVAFPAALLAVRTVTLLEPRTPMLSEIPGGGQILSYPLEQDAWESSSGVVRHLLSDGTVRSFPEGSIGGSRPCPQAWTARSEEGPVRIGFLHGVVVDGDTLRGDSLETRLESLRIGLREDRARLVDEVRGQAGAPGFERAMQRWNQFRRQDERTGLLLRDASDSVVFLRLSSLRQISRAPTGWIARAETWMRQILTVLSETPDSWGLGGLRQALTSTLALILLSGAIGGTLALLAALLLNERLRPGRWALVVRRSSEWLAAVPGVVWGGVGLGLLVWGAGAQLDTLLGDGLRWGNGGLLWASLTLGVLAAPISLKRSMEALEEVPKQWRLVARSCGATRWQVLRMVVLPSAWRGLLGAWLSAFARAAGETAPLMLVGAVHSIGGDVLETGIRLPSLSGGFPHLGVLACDPPWSVLEAELGHPVAYLSIFVLTLLCVGFELTASTFLLENRRRLAKDVEA